MALSDLFSKVSGGASTVAKYAKPIAGKALKFLPGVGTAYGIFGNPAKASGGEEGYWGDDNQWHTGKKAVGGVGYDSPIGPQNFQMSDASVNGNSTSGGGGGGNSYSGAPDDTIAKFNKNLGKQYGNFKNSLDDLSGFTSADEDRMRKSIMGMGSQLKSGLGTNLQAQRGVLDKGYSNVQSNQQGSLRDLAGSVQSEMRNANDYLGTRGAADSSASQGYARGLMGEASLNRRNILDQARGQYAEIETKRKQADQFYETELQGIDRWTEQNIDSVKSSYAESRSKLEKLARNADDYEKEDLERLNTQNLEKAYEKISEIENSRQQWVGQMDSWKNDVYGKMDNLKKELIGMTEFSAQDIEMPEMNADMEDYRQLEQEEMMNPVQKRRNSLRDFLDNPLSDEELY